MFNWKWNKKDILKFRGFEWGRTTPWASSKSFLIPINMNQFSNNFQYFNQKINHQYFIAFLLTNFRKISKFGVLWLAIFNDKFLRISQKFSEKFSTFSKSKKTIVVVPKLAQNHYIDQSLAKFFLKTPKNNQFFPKNLNFSKLSAPSPSKIWSFMSQKSRIFWSWGSHLGRSSLPPKNNILIIMNLYLYTI